MLSKSQIGLLKSLQQKKFRAGHGLFLVEGHKSINEFIDSDYQIETIYHIPAFEPKLLKLSRKMNFHEISSTELLKISALKTPQDVIALVKIPNTTPLTHNDLVQKFALCLDGIQDPGNMGTIIRTADWFGIKHIICSNDTVDVFNPKVVQAAMGSLAHVNVHYTDLAAFLAQINIPSFGASLNGASIYETNFGNEGLIIMGNEGNGLSEDVIKQVGQAITIPRKGNAESLNVAIAAAIFCAEINRNSYK